LGTPAIDLVSPGWEDIGLGAITDIVKHTFGPVDLDRSPVALAGAAQPQVGCPACAGRRFGFLADLAEAQARMCRPHRVKADTLIRARLARANASNPDGWAAITEASSRIDRPHLPGGLATKLANASQGMYVVAEPAELADRARLVIEAAGAFPNRPNDFAVALGEEPDLAGFLPDWLVNLVADLGRAGLAAEAVAVGDALAAVDPGLGSMLDGDVAVALARAGLVDQALAKIEENVTRLPDDCWIRIHAGDALLALGDPVGAATHYQTAVDLAEQDDEVEARYDAIRRLQRVERLNRPERRDSKPEPGRRPTDQRNQKVGGGRSRRKRRR
jgi:tetratricopeptide (TPR) repeat protein